MSELDYTLSIKYKNMVGFTNFNNFTNTTIINLNVTIGNNLYVSNSSIFNDNITVLGNMNVSGYAICNSNLTTMNLYGLGNLSVDNNITANSVIISGNTFLDNNLTVNSTCIINNNLTCLNSLFVSNNTVVNGDLYSNNIIGLTTQVSIFGNNIIIGTTNSIINIYGTTTNIINNQLNIADKLISINTTNASNVIGDSGSCGIEILGISGNGFILTTPDSLRYQIKAPRDPNINYITAFDDNWNLLISGYTIFYNNVTIGNNLYVSGDTNINNNFTIMADLNVLNNIICNTTLTILSTLTALSSLIVNSSMTIGNELYVSNDLQVSNLTVSSNLYTNNLYTNNITCLGSVFISNNANILNNITIASLLNIGNTAVILNNITIGTNLSVMGNTLINNNLTIGNKLYVSSNCYINNNSTFNSNLFVSGNTIINGNATIGSTITTSTININGQIINPLKNYDTNLIAANNQVPTWGLYHTSGIVKVRLDIIPPILILNGPTTITQANNIIDPGVSATDNDGSTPIVYLTSITDGSNNEYLSSSIVINSNYTNLNIQLNNNVYYFIYTTTDLVGNKTTGTRTVNIVSSASINTPILLLNGDSTLTNKVNTIYIDPGVQGTDIMTSSNTIVYILAIYNNSNNILRTPIQIVGTSTSIPTSNTFSVGNYSILYGSIDSHGNINKIIRTLNIIP